MIIIIKFTEKKRNGLINKTIKLINTKKLTNNLIFIDLSLLQITLLIISILKLNLDFYLLN
jgi:hypothetical protein